MRKLITLSLAAGLCAFLATSAGAANLPFSGALTVQIGTLPGVVASGSGVATVNGSAGGAHLSSLSLAGGTFSTPFAAPVTSATPIFGVFGTAANGAGAFAGGSTPATPLSGLMPVLGTSNVCLFSGFDGAPCPGGAGDQSGLAILPVPFTRNGTVGVGLGGTLVATGGISVTVRGAPWQTGVVTVPTANGNVSATGFVHGPGSGTAAASTAAQLGGVVQLVTPVEINTNIGGSETIPAFGILTLQFVPEPGTLLLLGSGVAGLAILGRRRMRG